MKNTVIVILVIAVGIFAGCSFNSVVPDEGGGDDLSSQDVWLDDGPVIDTGRDVAQPDEGGVDASDHGITDTSSGKDLFESDNSETDFGVDINQTDDGHTVDVATDVHVPRGRITVIPYLIDFGFVPLGASARVPILVRNDGDAALRLDRFTTNGPTSIKLDVGFEPQVSGMKTTYVIDPPRNLKPGATFEGAIVFEPTAATEAYSEIRVFSSDSDYPDGYLAHATGNKTKPDVDLNPTSMDFGAAVVGTPQSRNLAITSNGGMNVKIRGVYPDQNALDAGYRVEFPEVEPTVGTPVTLAPVQKLNVTVVYDPTRASPVDQIGRPIPEQGQIIVSGDMFNGNEFTRVSGYAVEGACTRPIIELLNESFADGDGCPVDGLDAETRNTRICRTAEGYEVPTGTLLRLSGSQSFSPFGGLNSWTWSVTQPASNGGIFIPDNADVTPAFMVGAAVDGTTPSYELFLDVADGFGHTACQQDSLKIVTRTEVKADVILSWTPVNPFTPVPPYMGQDLDLHFTHPNAGTDATEGDCDGDGLNDNWFDDPWDCYWLNPVTAKDLWGEALPWTNDRVSLRNDNDDGQEPEVLSMGLECPNGRKFKVGAYFFDDHGYGDVFATVQVYVKGTLAYSQTQRLASSDMWYVGQLQCVTNGLDKTGSFSAVGAKVVHNYINDGDCPVP